MTFGRRLSLIKTEFEQHEKRILPRFPVCYLTFKPKDAHHAFQVKDLSFTGMQLQLLGDKDYEEGESIEGLVHWFGQELLVQGKIIWKTKSRVGIEFLKRTELIEKIKSFFSDDKFVKALKPMHQMNYGVELPAKLKYWLRSDGPVEILVWQHQDGEFSHFQLLFMDSFVEWIDGKGVKTGRIMSKRNVDTPLLEEDKLVFRIDEKNDDQKIDKMKSFLAKVNDDLLRSEVKKFLSLKLS